MFPAKFLFSILCMLSSASIAAASWDTMVPMNQIGPQPHGINPKDYAEVIHVGPDSPIKSVTSALAAVKDASAAKHYAVLVTAGTYKEASIPMKPYVDLYGGFKAGDWKKRDVYQHAAILDAQQQG